VLSGRIDQVSSHVARILREEREDQALSMTSLAERSGLSRTMIRFVERETRNPSLETLLRLTFALGLDLGEVIHRAAAASGWTKWNEKSNPLTRQGRKKSALRAKRSK